MAKTLEQLKRQRDQIAAVKAKNRNTLAAAQANVEQVKTEMAKALEDGNIQLYSEKAAALERANNSLKTAQDAAAVTDSFPECKEDDVVAAWAARCAVLNKDIQKAEREYSKAMETFKDAYLSLARVMNRCCAERDAHADLINPDAFPKVKYEAINYYNEYLKLPADFARLARPFDNGKMHPRIDEPLKWYRDDPSVKAANAVIFSGCASSVDF